MLDLTSVLFVCSGNIFRSAFAEHYYRQKIYPYKYSYVYSRGTALFYKYPNPIVSGLATEMGVNIAYHRPKPLKLEDLEKATVVFVMEGLHYQQILNLAPEYAGKIYFLGLFSESEQAQIPDIKQDEINFKMPEIKNTLKVIGSAIDRIIRSNTPWI